MTIANQVAERSVTRDLLRAGSALAIAEGLAFAIAGKRAARVLEKVVPSWSVPWLGRLEAAPDLLSRLYGAAQIALGLRVLAMTPPTPPLVEAISDLALEPIRTLWRFGPGAEAERTYGQLLNEMVRPGARVLDLGCGEGDNLARILEEDLDFGSYVGLDRSSSVLARARARFDGLPKVAFLANDLNQDQLPHGEFDVILCTWALDRIPDPNDLIIRAMRQLRYGGNAIILYASPVDDSRRPIVDTVAQLTGRALRPATLFNGLPSFTAVESFSHGLISLVVLEKSERANPLVPHPVGVGPI